MMRGRVMLMLALCATLAAAQEQASKPAAAKQQAPVKTETKTELPAPAKAPMVSAGARLKAATTVVVKRIEGGDLAPEAIISTLEGWGRFTVLNRVSRDKGTPPAPDLIIEVSSPDEESGGGISVSSSTSQSSPYGRPEQSTTTRREISTGSGQVKMVIRDAKSGAALWMATEEAKGAMKKNARENNVVEAAQRLVSKFRQRIEPQ